MSYEIITKDKNRKTQYDNIKLHDLITQLKKELQQFYDKNITHKLFDYELLI